MCRREFHKYKSFSSCRLHSSVFLPNVYHPGMSINNGHDDERNSVEECQHLCQQTDGCNVFTWYSERKWCWLKSGIAASIELQGAISGPKQCGRSI